MVNLDFANIREHDGSKDKGFEELICQLAHLNHPDNVLYFVRKEGDGGDAGVECYWKLKNDTEHAWQAKYFLDVLTDNQWGLISSSIETALEKHPKLTKYYVCLPRDWTDSRKKVNGKVIKSSWDKWIDHKKSWEELAHTKGMEVEFIYWCKHEISQMLHVDKPEYSGRALYWFNEPIINSTILLKISEKSKKSLGERFTPEFNVELPIAKKFDCLGFTNSWKSQLKEQSRNAIEMRDEYDQLLKYRINLFDDKDLCNKVDTAIKQFSSDLLSFILEEEFFQNIDRLIILCQTVYKSINDQIDSVYGFINTINDEEIKKKQQEIVYELRKISKKADNIYDFLSDDAILAGKTKSILLLGEAGIGKSHLLCDISLKRLEEGLPTLFLLGQHYPGGNPINFICSELGLSNYPYRIVLGALDALGESKNTRFLIVIDAINEGVYREAWHDNIISFLTELGEYAHIAIVLSCRSTYKTYLIPSNNDLTEIKHYGFRGYEHRAALKYLAKQGISKPGTPILTPEFSNPLFLKTCCKAIKKLGKNEFPRGLNGFIRLYEFYIESVEQVIGRVKRYRSGENIVSETIKKFVDELYPNNISGLPVSSARQLITAIDPKPEFAEPLFDILIDEGVLALDIIPNEVRDGRGVEVVRFTYERFSDYAIAINIINGCSTEKEISELFLPGGKINKIINGNNKYRFGGIIEALSIIIPEKFHKEFIEFLKFKNKNDYEYTWYIERTFKDIILWRTGNSISSKSLELLNRISSNMYRNESLDILLALSAEPGHPWNADFLDANLARRKMPDRDAFWSTYIAINDRFEDEDSEESIVRTLIDWALTAEMKDVEPERLRLIAIVLLWMTTTSNRKVRDQATKSLSRVFFYIPQQIVKFIEKYNKCDDIYLVERLYAAIYGAIIHLDNDKIIKEISVSVYNYQFKNRKPYPDIMLRDYARGIMEFAYHKNLISDLVDNPDMFRPPYVSKWPILTPSEKEIDEITKSTYSSIKSSLMGYIGDFGNYSMGCITDWSPTSISSKRPQTGNELQRKFVKKIPEELREKYLKYIDYQIKKERIHNRIDLEKWLNDKITIEILKEKHIKSEEKTTWELLKEEISNSLNETDKDEFNWLNGLGYGDRPAHFNKKWAQRWVCKKAYDLGWTEELFAEFEKKYSKSGRFGREGGGVERIGKKYQWIGFHEILARMSDNLLWIDHGYSDLDDHKFFGPWQIHKRDIDPTLWLRKTGYNGWRKIEKQYWWQPYIIPFVEERLEDQIDWLWNRTIIPPLADLLTVTNPEDNKEWIILQGFAKWEKQPIESRKNIPAQDAWYRVNSCLINKDDWKHIKLKSKNRDLRDPFIIGVPSTGHQGYFGEYPWHPYYNSIDEWRNEDEEWNRSINVKYHVPVNEYEWESGSVDHSLDESISFYMPSSKLIADLHLTNIDIINPGAWTNDTGELVFLDPSVMNEGPSYGLIRKDIIQKWLEENNLLLVWLIGGEKQLFTEMAEKFYGRLVYNGMFALIDNEIKGELWFEEER